MSPALPTSGPPGSYSESAVAGRGRGGAAAAPSPPHGLVLAALAAVASSLALPVGGSAQERPAERPGLSRLLVVGHRGASGYRPEHTLAAYELALDLGADYVEPDLVSTRDGVLVARHETELSTTTDVAEHPEFAGRRTTKTVDGRAVTGWFAEDFTLAELKTLRARERVPDLRPNNARYDGRYEIPTLDEVIALVRQKSAELGRPIGLYPETKHPTHFARLGLPLERPLVEALHRAGYTGPGDPVFIQSFEVQNLRDLARLTRLRLVQLLDDEGRPYDFEAAGDPRTYADLATPEGLREIAAYAVGVGAAKDLILPRDAAGRLLAPTPLVGDAHAAGLVVHAWTFRNENAALPLDFRVGDGGEPTCAGLHGDALAEYAAFYRLGVDGVFSDYPDVAVEAREALVDGSSPSSPTENPP